MLKINRISTYNEFIKYRDVWKELIQISKVDNIFLTFEWIDACIRYFCKDGEILVLAVVDGDRLIGIAPLMIKRYTYFGLPVKTVCFIGNYVSDRMDFIVADRHIEVIMLILDYIMYVKEEWDLIDLQEIEENSKTLDIIKGWLDNKRSLYIIGPAKKSFFIKFNGRKEDLFRLFFNRFNKRLKKIGKICAPDELRFRRYIENLEDGDRLFCTLNKIERHSWKASKHVGIFCRDETNAFYRDTFKTFLKNGWLDISILEVGKEQVAFIYNFLYKNHSYNYSIAFDERYSYLSPGTMLMLWALQDSARRYIEEYDFIRGDAEWKTRLTDTFRMHQRVRIFKGHSYHRLLFILQRYVMPNLKKIGPLYKVWMGLKTSLQR